jgi:hypothetical protein
VALILALSWHGSASAKPAGIEGHVIGETAANFLRLEPALQQKADGCRAQAPAGPDCASLLSALDRGERAEISTAGSMHFLFDQGQLIRVTMLLDGAADAAAADLTSQFGAPSRHNEIAGQNELGSNWTNHLFTWETSAVSFTLYEDNNPLLQDRRPLLVVESRENNQKYTISVRQLAAVEVGANRAPAR